jgi:hypothetical protein
MSCKSFFATEYLLSQKRAENFGEYQGPFRRSGVTGSCKSAVPLAISLRAMNISSSKTLKIFRKASPVSRCLSIISISERPFRRSSAIARARALRYRFSRRSTFFDAALDSLNFFVSRDSSIPDLRSATISLAPIFQATAPPLYGSKFRVYPLTLAFLRPSVAGER